MSNIVNYKDNNDGTATITMDDGTVKTVKVTGVTGVAAGSGYQTTAKVEPVDRSQSIVTGLSKSADMVSKAGAKSEVNWGGNISTDAAAGSTLGGAIGTAIVPVVGTAIGSAIGAGAGAIAGVFQSVYDQGSVDKKNQERDFQLENATSEGVIEQREKNLQTGQQRLINDMNVTKDARKTADFNMLANAYSRGIAHALSGGSISQPSKGVKA